MTSLIQIVFILYLEWRRGDDIPDLNRAFAGRRRRLRKPRKAARETDRRTSEPHRKSTVEGRKTAVSV